MASQSRGYKAWTNVEETKLVEALVNLVNSGGFKADNGFKSGYLQHLEQVLKKSLPNSSLLAKPHIESKMRIMKKDWQSVHEMLNGSDTSGFKYDGKNHCVVAEDDVWESYIKVHPKAGRWKNKEFRRYEDLCIIFGKDRAQGNKIRDSVETEKEANIEEDVQQLDNDSDNVMESSHIQRDNVNLQSEENSSARDKKRKSREEPIVDGFNDAITYLGSGLSNIAKNMNKYIEREEAFDKKSSMTTFEISKMKSLTQTEKFKAMTKFQEDPRRVKLFWDLGVADREPYVKFVLQENMS